MKVFSFLRHRYRPCDADPCTKVFRRPPLVVPDPSLSADRHVPDTGGQPCANSFGLWLMFGSTSTTCSAVIAPDGAVPRPFHTCRRPIPSRRSLRSVDTNRLVVPISRLSTVGSRAFPVAGQQTRNDLPEDVTSSAESLTTFRRLLKTNLLRKSFPDYLLDIN